MQDEPHVSPSVSVTRLEPGLTLHARYKVISLIASGGQASVFLCEDLQMSRQVALKVLSLTPDENASERFKREARILGSLKHPNIVTIFASGNLEDGSSFLAMEYVQGKALSDLLAEKKTLSGEEIVTIFSQLLQALDYLHANGVLHRDLKPGNILIRKADENADMEAMLLDFGIAKIFDQELYAQNEMTKSAGSIGTPNYMSPEQCQNKPLSPASDLYSLACVMYEAAGGTAPFSGASPLDIMYKQTNESLPALSNVHEKLSAVIFRALEKDPSKRYGGAREMLADLPQIADLDTLKLKKEKSEKQKSSDRKILVSIMLLLAVCLVCAALFLIKNKASNNSATASVMEQHMHGDKLLLGIENKPLEEGYKLCQKVLKLDPKSNRGARLRALPLLGAHAKLFEGPAKELEYCKLFVKEASEPRQFEFDTLSHAYSLLAQAYQDNRMFDDAAATHNKIIQIANSRADRDKNFDLAGLYYSRAKYYISLYRFADSEPDLKTAESLAVKCTYMPHTDLDPLLATIYDSWIDVLLRLGKDVQAAEILKKLNNLEFASYELPGRISELALRFCERSKNKALGKIAMDDALAHLDHNPVADQRIKVFVNKIMIDHYLGDKQAKKQSMKIAQALLDNRKDKKYISVFRFGFGASLACSAEPLAAEREFKQTIIDSHMDDPIDNFGAMAAISLAEIFTKQGRYNEAQHYLDLALDYCRRVSPKDSNIFAIAIRSQIKLNEARKKPKEDSNALTAEFEKKHGFKYPY